MSWALNDAWWHAGGNIVVVLIENTVFMLATPKDHLRCCRTGWLSLVVVCILLFTGWKGWEMVYRYRVGVADVENREATPATTRRAA